MVRIRENYIRTRKADRADGFLMKQDYFYCASTEKSNSAGGDDDNVSARLPSVVIFNSNDAIHTFIYIQR